MREFVAVWFTVSLLVASGVGDLRAETHADFGATRSRTSGERTTQWLGVVAEVEPRSLLDALDRSGHEVAVAIWPRAILVRSRPDAGPLPAFVRPIDPHAASEGDLASLLPPPDALRTGRAGTASPAPGLAGADLRPFDRPDALPPLRASRGSAGASVSASPSIEGLPHGARWRSVSEFLYGRVALSILFPESDGSIDPSRFDWTPALRDSVLRATARGLLHWIDFAAAHGVPLSFVLEVHTGLPTGYEPIDRPVGEDLLWITETLEPLVGYRSDAASMGYDVANAARARLGAQWAGLVFAVQDDTLSRGSFPDGFIAYAQLGGPWFVLPLKNGSGLVSLDFYVAHELGHLFWALDESPALQWACTLTSGYFNQENTNSDWPSWNYCKDVTQQCLMKGFYIDSLCTYSARQLGWVDLDRTGVLDIYETRATVKPESTLVRAAPGNPVTLRAIALETAWPNRNPYHFGSGDSISIASIDSAEYRVDGGVWTRLLCADGRCDSGEEGLVVALPGFPIGAHTVEWRAWNSNGRTAETPATTLIQVSDGTSSVVSGEGSEAPLDVFLGPNPAGSRVRIEARGVPGRAGRIRIFDVRGREVLSRAIRIGPEGSYTIEWDGRPERGGARASGIYFIRVDSGPDRIARRLVFVR